MLLTFASTRSVVKAEEILKSANIGVKAVPLAKNINARCGIGLEVEQNDVVKVEIILKGSKIDYSLNG